MRSFLLFSVASLLIAGCNTVEGLGRDIRTVGDTLDRTVHDAREGQPPAPVETGSTTARPTDELSGAPGSAPAKPGSVSG